MIVEFSVKNYRSINDLQTLSFKAADIVSSTKIDKNNIFEVGGNRLLKTVGIYGANASGKSNVLLAFEVFCSALTLVPTPDKGTTNPIFHPFRFQQKYENSEVFLQIFLIIRNRKYRYGFTVVKNPEYDIKNPEPQPRSIIKSEWLYEVGSEKNRICFDREGLEVDKSGLSNRDDIPKIPYDTNFFLLHAASFGSEICNHILRYIRLSARRNSFDIYEKGHIERIIGDREYRSELIKLFSDFGIDYADFEVENKNGNNYYSGDVYVIKKSRKFNLYSDESAGTRKLFNLAGHLIYIFNANESGILVLDEIDSNFHPKLVIRLIEMFNNPKINKSNSQLLFTSHDTNLLNPAIMRRDQFYFTEKDLQDATRLYSLSDLKGIPNDADFARQYLAGFYGALPVLYNFKNEPVTEDV